MVQIKWDNISSQQMGLGKSDIHMQKNEDGPLYHKQNQKWIKDLTVSLKTLKLSEENIQENLRDTGFGVDFLDIRPKAQITNGKTGELNYIKI